MEYEVNPITGEIIEPVEDEMNALIQSTPMFNGMTIDEAYVQMQALEEQIGIWKQKNKEAIMQIFKEHGIKSFKNDYISITYQAPTEQKRLDQEKVKRMCLLNGEDIEELKKTVPVREQIKISIKER